MEQRQTAPAQDTERAVVDLETFERVWRRVMPNQDMSPIQVGAPTGPGTGVERQAERIPAPAPEAANASVPTSSRIRIRGPPRRPRSRARRSSRPRAKFPLQRSRPLGRSGSWRS